MSKRALIVDDSRSARAILSRMLEGYGLSVDTCESAEQALRFLEQQRPDVIFMDHLMPGMDGFQAVQAIKHNPATAMIPVIMYTSQEGELYVSQARALGAVGVLPKTVKQADVSRVLYQLRLLPERRDLQEPVLTPVELTDITNRSAAAFLGTAYPGSTAAHASKPPADWETTLRHVLNGALKDHQAEMRRWLTTTLDNMNARPHGGHEVVLNDVSMDSQPPARAIGLPALWAWVLGTVAALALLTVMILGALHVRTQERLRATQALNTQLGTQIEAQELAALTSASAAADESSLEAAPSVPSIAELPPAPVPYGEVPLASERVDRLRQLLNNLSENGFEGTVRATTFTGDFCLTGNAVEGYVRAEDDLPARGCDLIANPYDDNLRSAQRQSLAFANLISAIRQETRGSIDVQVEFEGRQPAVPYPPNPPPEKLTAGEWNRIAERNNRVEFALEPRIKTPTAPD